MAINYCLPLIKNNRAEILDSIRTNGDSYSYFEVWLDYIDPVDDVFIKDLIGLAGEKLILLFRRRNLEPIKMPLARRLEILQLLDQTPARADLDITTQTAELDYLRDNDLDIKIITSYHDYEKTPDTVRLEAIIATMEAYRPAVYKLAVKCGNQEDALRLLQQLLSLKAQDRAAIVLGMGPAGLVTRVFGALWGNEMTFAPLAEGQESAPGQLSRQKLEVIFKELGV